MDAAELLHEARLAAGLSQAALAERSGTSQATLCAYERGAKSPSAATLERILAAAGRQLVAAPRSRPVRSPGAAALERAGRTLDQVIGLAEELPTRHRDLPMFPGLSQRSAPRP